MTRKPIIYVLAGVNGSGKSSVGGVILRKKGGLYFNPDEAAKKIAESNPDLSMTAANSIAWNEGRRLLERAISERLDYTFETTLGGETITNLIEQAITAGMELWIWYVGLSSVELCIERVAARAAAGGHSIPEEKIRERYITSPLNLIRLMPGLSRLRVYDNSVEGDPRQGKCPKPLLLLEMQNGKAITTCELRQVPRWAKPILAAAVRSSAK